MPGSCAARICFPRTGNHHEDTKQQIGSGSRDRICEGKHAAASRERQKGNRWRSWPLAHVPSDLRFKERRVAFPRALPDRRLILSAIPRQTATSRPRQLSKWQLVRTRARAHGEHCSANARCGGARSLGGAVFRSAGRCLLHSAAHHAETRAVRSLQPLPRLRARDAVVSSMHEGAHSSPP